MKPLTFTILVVMMCSIATPKTIALFGHVAAEKDRREHVEQQFVQERQTNGRLYVAIGILSAGVTVALVVGAAVGSKTRRDVQQP